MSFRTKLKNGLKIARASQPFNLLATTSLRQVMHLTGKRHDGIIKHLHRVGRTRDKLPNGHTLNLWSRGDDWVSNQVFWRGWESYEPESGLLFFRLAQRAQVTFDVGSYVGFYSLLAAHANPRGQVFAFEPMPQIFKRLCINIGLNHLKNVHCYHTAVGQQPGTAEFYHATEPLPTSSSLSFDFMKDVSNLTCSKVPVITLDDFVEERKIERVDLVKIDTESTEPDVLRGMEQTLRRDHPDLICEVLYGRGSGEALAEVLRPLGYTFYLLTPQGPQRREHIEGHPEWFNYLFTTRSAAEIERL